MAADKASPSVHSPQLYYKEKLHKVDPFQKIVGFKQLHSFQNLGEAQQDDIPSQPAKGERAVCICDHAHTIALRAQDPP